MLIKEYSSVNIGGKEQALTEIKDRLTDMLRGNTDEKLTLQDSYFNAEQDAYIVIEVYYEGEDTPAYVMIRINAGDPLFNLTENTIDSIGDCVAERRYCGA